MFQSVYLITNLFYNLKENNVTSISEMRKRRRMEEGNIDIL